MSGRLFCKITSGRQNGVGLGGPVYRSVVKGYADCEVVDGMLIDGFVQEAGNLEYMPRA